MLSALLTTIGLRELVQGLRQPHHTLNLNVTFPAQFCNHARFRTPPTRYSPHPELARTHASKDQLTNCASVLRTSGTFVQQHWRGFRAPYMYTVCYTRRRLNARWGRMGTRANLLRVCGQPGFSWRCYCRAVAAAQRMMTTQRAIYISETQGLHSLHKLCMNCQLRGRVVERRVGSGRMLQVRKMMLDTVVLIYVALILISRST